MLKKRQNEVQRNIFLFDEVKKNIAGQVLTYNSKIFHWLNKQLDLEGTMSELGKSFLKNKNNQMKKKTKKKQKIDVKMLLGRTKKPLVICNFDSNKQLGPEWAVNGLGKLFRKSDPKNRKNSKRNRL